jgi:hypothetical protein
MASTNCGLRVARTRSTVEKDRVAANHMKRVVTNQALSSATANIEVRPI